MQVDQLNKTFAALSDPTRRAILARLGEGEALLKDLAEPFDMTLPAVAKHLRVLEDAGLIIRGRDAQRRPVRLVGGPLAAAVEWLEHYRSHWDTTHHYLDELLEELETEARNAVPPAR